MAPKSPAGTVVVQHAKAVPRGKMNTKFGDVGTAWHDARRCQMRGRSESEPPCLASGRWHAHGNFTRVTPS